MANWANGNAWLSAWNAGCRNLTGSNCSFAHMCLHTYFEPSQVDYVFDSLQSMHSEYGKPIWLNEFACPPYENCSAADQLVFAREVVPRLEATPYVYRYAWFEARAVGGEALLANLTSPLAQAVQRTALGDWYNSFAAP